MSLLPTGHDCSAELDASRQTLAVHFNHAVIPLPEFNRQLRRCIRRLGDAAYIIGRVARSSPDDWERVTVSGRTRYRLVIRNEYVVFIDCDIPLYGDMSSLTVHLTGVTGPTPRWHAYRDASLKYGKAALKAAAKLAILYAAKHYLHLSQREGLRTRALAARTRRFRARAFNVLLTKYMVNQTEHHQACPQRTQLDQEGVGLRGIGEVSVAKRHSPGLGRTVMFRATRQSCEGQKLFANQRLVCHGRSVRSDISANRVSIALCTVGTVRNISGGQSSRFRLPIDLLTSTTH